MKHITKKGGVGECTAQKGNCPLGGWDDHNENETVLYSHIEAIMDYLPRVNNNGDPTPAELGGRNNKFGVELESLAGQERMDWDTALGVAREIQQSGRYPVLIRSTVMTLPESYVDEKVQEYFVKNNIDTDDMPSYEYELEYEQIADEVRLTAKPEDYIIHSVAHGVSSFETEFEYRKALFDNKPVLNDTERFSDYSIYRPGGDKNALGEVPFYQSEEFYDNKKIVNELHTL